MISKLEIVLTVSSVSTPSAMGVEERIFALPNVNSGLKVRGRSSRHMRRQGSTNAVLDNRQRHQILADQSACLGSGRSCEPCQ